VTPDLIGIAAAAARPAAPSSCCGTPSDGIHGRHVRTVANLPWHGRWVILHIKARRFRCRTAGCDRPIFCERPPTVLARHARGTGRLAEALRAIGFSLGGEAGSRLRGRLAVPASPDTLLRQVAAVAAVRHPTPRVLRADDPAFRKGRTHGTILVDLERRRPVDLLPDRTADTLADWLWQRPGLEMIRRDRASAYAQAAADASPKADRVADPLHLLANVRGAVERVLARHPAEVRDALADPTAESPPLPAPAPEPDPPHV
jgi:transposase